MEKKRVVVLISGRGSNMAALIEAARDRDYPAEIVGVISDKADAMGLQTASKASIATRIVARGDFSDNGAHDGAIDEALEDLGAELVCLAGYMRRLTPGFVGKWSGRLINIHPSLLPLFKGLHCHRQALEAGVRIHGCSVHFVTATLDSGPVIAQAAVPVLPDDGEDALSDRVLVAEHKLYPMALRMVAEGHAELQGDHTIFDGLAVSEDAGERSLVSPEPDAGAVDLESLARFTP